MPKLSVFESISVDGYFTGANNDLSWAHAGAVKDAEWESFVSGNAQQGGALLFGRVTYEMMIAYWPTPAAAKNDPKVAEGMNASTKYVFSRTMKDVSWQNTTLLKGDPATEVRELKQGSGPDLVILGSGSIVAQLTKERLIDSYQFVVLPVALGKGRTVFDGIPDRVALQRTGERAFRNGNVLVTYSLKV